jgi:hypothetical protein
MLVRREGQWVEEVDIVPFHTRAFTVDTVRRVGYKLRDHGKTREQVQEALCKYVVADPDEQWGVGQDWVDNLLDDMFPPPKEQVKLF